MVVYVDSLFLLNLLVNYLLLLCAGRLAGEALHRLRLALAAVVGALYAVAVVLPGMGWCQAPPVQVVLGILMVLIGYGGSGRLLRVTLVFFAVSCALGGGILALELLGRKGGLLAGRQPFPVVDFGVVVIAAAVCYALAGLIFRGIARKRSTAKVTVTWRGNTAAFEALVDTGNGLTDPHSGSGVIVVEGERVKELFPLGLADLGEPASALEALSRRYGPMGWRLVPYHSVGVEWGLLVAFLPEKVTVDGQDRTGMPVALAPGTVGAEYGALVGER